MTDRQLTQHPGANPRLYYGYIVVMFSFLIMMVSQGIFNAFGIFFNPLLDEFSWTRAVISGAFSLSMGLRGIVGIVMGGLTDRIGPRLVLTFCGILIGLGYFLMSQASELWHLYVLYGVFLGVGMGGIWVPVLSTVTRWFGKKRSLMTGIVVAGVGIGGIVAPPVISRLINAYDWRVSFMMQGGFALLVLVAAAQFLRSARNGTARQLGYGDAASRELPLIEVGALSLGEAARTRQLWLVILAFFCAGFSGFSIVVHLVPYAVELGIPAVEAANLLSAMNGMSLLGILGLGGYIGDRIGTKRVYIIGFIMILAGLVWLMFARETWMLYVFVGVFGVAVGAMGAAEPPLIASLFGLSSHGLIFGVAGLGFTGGSAIGPLVTGYLFDVSGSYNSAFQVGAAVAVVGLMATFMFKPMQK